MIMGRAPGGGDAIKDVDIADFSDPHPVYRPLRWIRAART